MSLYRFRPFREARERDKVQHTNSHMKEVEHGLTTPSRFDMRTCPNVGNGLDMDIRGCAKLSFST